MGRVHLVARAVAAGGDAIARDADGRVVLVEGALPGEGVVAELVEEKRDYARARVVEVVSSSPGRVAPPCSGVAAGCGGCQWQHVEPAWQARLKRDIVVDALHRIARLADPPVASEVPAVPAWGHRTTLRLAVEDGRAVYRERRGRRPVVPEQCPVAHARLEELVVDGRFGQAAEVVLRVSEATGERLVVARPTAAGVDVPADVLVVGADERPRLRRAAVTEEVAGRRWRVSAESFFQSGPAAAELLVSAVRAAAGAAAGGTVVDAYAGIGLLGGSLPGVGRLLAVERHPSAVRDARHNLADLPAEVVQAEVAAWRAPSSAAVDLVVADPARPGLGGAASAALAAAGAARFVLVSCDPASLARDVRLLDGHGYALTGVQVLDLFPHTFHVEAVARFDAR
ncbi:MAG TPA: TRAM domain-containing protein [Acidimicrobiales bacterium]|nr:TRAM domain-containing protein [Acidimicrobiales bacterium]